MTELITPQGPVIIDNPEEDPYAAMTAGITFAPSELLERELHDERDAAALELLVNIFLGSEHVFNQLQHFVQTNWETALADVDTNRTSPIDSPLV